MLKAIIHCSDSPQGRGDNAATVHKWHQAKGWDGIGYHYVILEDGSIENGRPLYWKGAHAKGHNKTIGILLIGKDKFTSEQFIALRKLLNKLNLKDDKIVGHYELDKKKTCPNFNVKEFLKFTGGMSDKWLR